MLRREMVCDMDDVLAQISIPWLFKVARDPSLATESLRALAAEGNEQKAIVATISRRQSHIQDWLMAEYGLDESHRQGIDDLYRLDGEFYDEVPLTVFGRNLMTAIEARMITRFVVLSHVYAHGDPVNESKRRWFERHFEAYKDVAELRMIEATVAKSAAIAEVCPDVHAFADDSLKNVRDVALNTPVREVITPRYGHNEIPEDLMTDMRLRRVSHSYYMNVL